MDEIGIRTHNGCMVMVCTIRGADFSPNYSGKPKIVEPCKCANVCSKSDNTFLQLLSLMMNWPRMWKYHTFLYSCCWQIITSLKVSLQNLDMSEVFPTSAGPAVTRVTWGPGPGAWQPRYTDIWWSDPHSPRLLSDSPFLTTHFR